MARLVGYPIVLALSIALIVIYRLYIVADSRALHDELTQLPNRRYFMKSYQQQFEIAKRYKSVIALPWWTSTSIILSILTIPMGMTQGTRCWWRVQKESKHIAPIRYCGANGGDEFLIIVHNPKTEENIQALLKNWGLPCVQRRWSMKKNWYTCEPAWVTRCLTLKWFHLSKWWKSPTSECINRNTMAAKTNGIAPA